MKRTLSILLVLLPLLGWAIMGLWSKASAQRRRPPAPSKYAKFTHKSHTGQVKNPFNKTQSIELDCAYCHGTATRDRLGANQHDLEAIGYPSHLRGAKEARAHTACNACHAFAGSAIQREMCSICHLELTPNPVRMATNLRRFPNPDGPGQSQFYDYFSHADHVDFYEQYATATPLKERVKFYDAKADARTNKGLDKQRFECASCHLANGTPITVAGAEFKTGVKMSAPGHPECFVCHFDPKIVTPPKKEKPDPRNTFATNCTGCHQTTAKPLRDGRPVKGSELMALWFDRQIVNTERNAAKPGVKSPLPYSHQTHFEAVGKSVQDCLSCHATGKTSQTRADFHLPDRKTKEKQPLPFSCVECHKKEMQTKIEGTVTVESAKCNYCHALNTIKELGAKGTAMPPESHFWKKPAPTPTPTPTPKPPGN